jgi:hypothetical protein
VAYAYVPSDQQARFTTRRWYVSALEMLVLGGCCAAVAYEIGSLVNALI